MTASSERQGEIDGNRRFAHSSFCRRDGYHLADIAYVALFGQASLAARDLWGCAGAREALRESGVSRQDSMGVWEVRGREGEGTKGFSWLKALKAVEKSLLVITVVSLC